MLVHWPGLLLPQIHVDFLLLSSRSQFKYHLLCKVFFKLSYLEWIPNLHQFLSSILCLMPPSSKYFFQPGDLPPTLGCDCQLHILTWLSASSNSREGAQIPFLPFPNLLFLQSSLFQLMATLFFQSFGAKP